MSEQEVLSAQKIWEGEIRETKFRILQIAEDDCYVEEFHRKILDGVWQAADDELASEVYMTAFLETRKLLKDVADFALSGPPKT